MARIPYIIRVSSQKGGVGKTTIAVNMAIALSSLNYKTVLIDADLISPNVHIALGMPEIKYGMIEALSQKCTVKEAIRVHNPNGLHVLPCLPSENLPTFSNKQIDNLGKQFIALDYDFVIVDTSPGILYETILKYYSEVLTVSTPEIAAVSSGIRLSIHYGSIKLKNNLVINRFRNRKNPLSVAEVEDLYQKKALAVLPEDEIVPNSLAERIPAYLINKDSKFCTQIRQLVKHYVSTEQHELTPHSKQNALSGIVGKLLGKK